MGQTLSAPKLLNAIEHESLEEIVQLLQQKKASAKSNLKAGGNKACHIVAESSSVRSVELLMAIIRGYRDAHPGHCDLDQRVAQLIGLRNFMERTPLMVASMLGHTQMVARLLQLGANVWEFDGSDGNIGRTALHLACRAGQLATVGVLLQWVEAHPERGRPPNTHFKWVGTGVAVTHGGRQAPPACGHVMVDVKTGAGFTPSHYAVHGNHVEVLRLLLQHGAAVSPRW
ncbi:MAG: hypothetical protein WDW38_008970 [Sanguina aurantia]